MKIKVIITIIIFIAIHFLLHDKCEAVSYYGRLTNDYPTSGNGLLITEGNWASGYTYLEWTVERLGGIGTPWEYTYTFYSSTSPDVSHVINELTGDEEDPFEIDIHFSTTPTYADIKLHEPSGTGNPNPKMPGDLYGIKFENFIVDNQLNTFSWIITTLHTPVWGDFYAKAGNYNPDKPDKFGLAWNKGFLDTDPSDPASDGSIDNHLLVPNGILVPEPSTKVLFLLGVLLMIGFEAIRRKFFL